MFSLTLFLSVSSTFSSVVFVSGVSPGVISASPAVSGCTFVVGAADVGSLSPWESFGAVSGAVNLVDLCSFEEE